MEPSRSALSTPRLRRLLRRSPASPARAEAPAAGRCELCAEPLPDAHRHLLELSRRELRCACRACALLLDRKEAGGARYHLVPERLWWLEDLELPEDDWRRLGVPVGTAFLQERRAEGRVVACYPGPLGLTEAHPDPETWRRIAAGHPALAGLEPDVEALLVHRGRALRRAWLAPLDECFRLVACLRTHWRGLSGGDRVWGAIEAFFEELHARATPVRREALAPDGRRIAAATRRTP